MFRLFRVMYCIPYNIRYICSAHGWPAVCFHLPLVGRCCFPYFLARDGRWVRVAAVWMCCENTQQIICVIKAS